MKHLFILNRNAGTKDTTPETQAKIEALGRSDIIIEYTREAGDAQRIAREYAEKGEPLRVYACGGDGTANEALHGLLGHENVALGLIPVGTGNDYIRSLPARGEDFLDMEKMVNGSTITVDLLKCNNRYALNVISVGYDCEVADRAQKNKRLWFGGEGNDNDPCAQTEDLGDDPFRASDYGIMNLKRIVGQLPGWTYEEGDMGKNLEQVYNSLVGQMRRYVGHVSQNIAGVYHHYKSAEEQGAVYTIEEKARQKKALAWLEKNVVTRPSWLISEPYVMRFSTSPERLIRPLADQMLAQLLSTVTLNRLCWYANDARAYQPEAYAADVVTMLFRETASGAKLSSWNRYIQQQAVKRLIKGWTATDSNDARPFITLMLNSIRQRLRTARTADATTRAHYTDLAQQITLAFEGKMPAQQAAAPRPGN
jgi:hypothetical protein